jgi:hypothetical protein
VAVAGYRDRMLGAGRYSIPNRCGSHSDSAGM